MDQVLLNSIVAFIGLGISIFVLIIHVKNRNINLKSFLLNRHLIRISGFELSFINSKEIDSNVKVNLAAFNPSSVGCLIKSLTVYKHREPNTFFERFLSNECWSEITEAKWWPTENPTCDKIKFMHDEYKNLYFEKYRDIVVSIPGCLSREKYKFHIKTNHGGYILTTDIRGGNTSFAHWSEQNYEAD